MSGVGGGAATACRLCPARYWASRVYITDEHYSNPIQSKIPTLVCSIGSPKLSSIAVSPVKGSEGSRGEDGTSDWVE